ncbi:hypothetical protein QW060_05540 [Myroides ceti]|uniref:Uncharacterized protein n=1 Tax=Paenimyroides ceti TaxID=395087 RepID=A0ABT8CRI3_9FLAO|nr:hypothetical protein [Paenimyroides ceti]MDN3706591.1 hypothetical protein [Paenimyroides ceti]
MNHFRSEITICSILKLIIILLKYLVHSFIKFFNLFFNDLTYKKNWDIRI